MPTSHIADIKTALLKREFPTVMMWNRLEGRPRTHHFNRALKAEVRDALWMLTKQWQMGEFKADDAGSPVFAKIQIASSKLTGYQAGSNPQQDFEESVPVEVKAEQKKISFVRDANEISIDIRLQMGKYWLKMLTNEGLDFIPEYIKAYTFLLPANDRSTGYIYAHKDIWQNYAAISGRCMDGYKFYEYISIPGKNASDAIAPNDPEKTALNDLSKDFKTWFEKIYYQPFDEKNNAWLPDRLEYQFNCNSKAGRFDKQLEAREYYQGRVDWWVFDIKEKAVEGNVQPVTIFKESFIPAHVEFDGMPNTRWWKFEDSKTNLGDIKPSTTDISKLLLVEFGLVFANDWFIFPYKLPIGSLANVESLSVRNNFGETIVINPTEQAGTPDNIWSMFKMHSATQNNTLFLAPAAVKVHESDPLEEIHLIRDEISNMVWGIETVVPSPMGSGDKGSEAALRIREFQEKIVQRESLKREALGFKDIITAIPNLVIEPVTGKSDIEKAIFDVIKNSPQEDVIVQELSVSLNELDFGGIAAALDVSKQGMGRLKEDLDKLKETFYKKTETILVNWFGNAPNRVALNRTLRFFELLKTNEFAAPIRYQVMTHVPEYWIPFIPVHIKNDNRETQLQRASMLRIIEGDQVPPVKIKPLTSILRDGLEEKPDPLAYYIHEEEVLRSGIKVTQSFQRTRWTNGEVYVWLGMKKKTGRGEGSSGLAFDQIEPTK